MRSHDTLLLCVTRRRRSFGRFAGLSGANWTGAAAGLVGRLVGSRDVNSGVSSARLGVKQTGAVAGSVTGRFVGTRNLIVVRSRDVNAGFRRFVRRKSDEAAAG
jgi:hypothetical protein